MQFFDLPRSVPAMISLLVFFQVKELEEQINGIRNRHHDSDAPIAPFELQQVRTLFFNLLGVREQLLLL